MELFTSSAPGPKPKERTGAKEWVEGETPDLR